MMLIGASFLLIHSNFDAMIILVLIYLFCFCSSFFQISSPNESQMHISSDQLLN